MLVGNSIGTSDSVNPLTSTPTQNSAILLYSSNLHFILHWRLFLFQGHSWCRTNHSFSSLGKNLNVQFPLQSNTSVFGMTRLLFFTSHTLYSGLAFLDSHSITRALKMLTTRFCSTGSLHFSMTLGTDTGAPSCLQAGQDFMGIRLNKPGQGVISTSMYWQCRLTLNKRKHSYFLEEAVRQIKIKGPCQKLIPFVKNIGIYLSQSDH